MALSTADRDRLLTLLDAVCDQRASAAEMAEIERQVLASPEARWLYVQYLDLHGTLIWDAIDEAHAPEAAAVAATPPAVAAPSGWARRRRQLTTVGVAVCLAMLCGIWLGRSINPSTTEVVRSDSPALSSPAQASPQTGQAAHTGQSPETTAPETLTAGQTGRPLDHRPADRHPVELPSFPARAPQTNGGPAVQPSPHPEFGAGDSIATGAVQSGAISRSGLPRELTAEELASLDDVTKVSRRIDLELARVWQDMGITPSPRAADDEWLRRVMLALTGRIPTVPELAAFKSADRTAARGDHRRALVDRLLADPEYVRHYSTVWQNLLIGRAPGPEVHPESLQKFLRMSFAANRPWNDIVAELLSAEGRTDENGATNYLVAHLNNQAVPATAITSRLFLGQQLHCAQCHNHPFNDLQQAAFWELNSLFQQTKVVRTPGKERMRNGMPRKGPAIAALVTEAEGGPIYYETTNGLMKVAFPRFNGQDVDPAPEVNRRRELARLLTTNDQPQLAAAFVNRTWAHFFGAGFTNPVDDMGPRNPPCHPEVLNLLRDEFIRSGYDVRQLIRWITATDAYQRAGHSEAGNLRDDPTEDAIPLFSRVYPQLMSAEQLYDSLLTATRAHQVGATDWEVAETQRQAWLQEFVFSLQNDENDEAETLSGTYSQALALMNGGLMQKALDPGTSSFFGDLMRSRLSDDEKVERLYQAALSRSPTARERTAVQKLVREAAAQRKSPAAKVQAWQDLFWALLNSNEFAIAH